jgi:hypothetical protein
MSMKTTRRGAASGALVLALAGPGCVGEVEQVPSVTTPTEAFASLEETLRSGGPAARVVFDVTAEGAISVDLSGTLLLGDGGRARVEASGNFAGQPLDVALISDGDRMFWTGADAGIETPPALRDALAIGFTRMGILHNLARLSGAMPPDHADGGVEAWVVVTPGDLDAIPVAGLNDSTSAVLDITVAGQPSGSFALVFDGTQPVVRHQSVEFPQGIMRVTERYRVVEIGADLPAGAFDTTPLDPSR